MESDHEQDNNNNNQIHHNNKLLIKLKMPIKLDDHQEPAADNTIHHVTNNTPRVCPECKKEFGSGKALGGHMRIHAEAIRKQQRRQKMLSSVNQCKNEEDNMCILCGKKFPSMKSLSGHMRCHPGREWRGIQPPLDLLLENGNNNFLSEEDEDEDEDEDVDVDEDEYDDDDGAGGDAVPVVSLLAAMPKWGEKARRGRKGVSKSSAGSSGVMVSEEDEEEKLRNAVNDLMLLKQVDCSESSGVSTLAAAAVAAQNSRDMNQQHEVSYSNSLTLNNREEEFCNVKFQASYKKVDDHVVMEKMGMEEGGSNDHVITNISDHYTGQEANVAHHIVENHHVEDEYDSRRTELLVTNDGGNKQSDWVNHKDDNVEMVTGSSRNKKARKMKLMMDLDHEKPSAAAGSAQAVVSTNSTEKYRCNTCNKRFSSHQALGGHRSSHNKFKLTIINAESGTHNQPSSVNAFAVSDHHLVRNEEFDRNHLQYQHNSSPDKVNRVMSEECANKKGSPNEGAGSSKGDHSSSTIHQCEVCNKIFPTGQALGGHKRCHWTASSPDQPQPQAPLGMTSSGEEASTHTGANHIQNIGLDLNLPPPMEDDFEAQGGGGGAAADADADAEHATRLHL